MLGKTDPFEIPFLLFFDSVISFQHKKDNWGPLQVVRNNQNTINSVPLTTYHEGPLKKKETGKGIVLQ